MPLQVTTSLTTLAIAVVAAFLSSLKWSYNMANRIITKAEKQLRSMMLKLEALSETCYHLANELRDSDARETRPDPRLRRKPKKSR